MSTMRVFVSFYARPLTKETFNEYFQPLVFSEEASLFVGEDVRCYIDDYFWDEFKSKMYEKSIYKFAGILEIEYFKYTTGEGYEEYDAAMHITETLLLQRAGDLTELTNALSASEILSKFRFRTRRKAISLSLSSSDLIKDLSLPSQ